jgi:hypothetical protein
MRHQELPVDFDLIFQNEWPQIPEPSWLYWGWASQTRRMSSCTPTTAKRDVHVNSQTHGFQWSSDSAAVAATALISCDPGDAYVVKSFDFTTNADTFASTIGAQSAGNGAAVQIF